MRVRAIVAGLAAAAALTGCASAEGSGHSVVGAATLVIGVAKDQPGLGFRSGGVYKGFDIDITEYVAGSSACRRRTSPSVR